MVRTVEVCDYDPRWPDRFQAEAARLKSVFGDELEAIHHIGSTAVPGLRAKPIIIRKTEGELAQFLFN